MLQEKIDNSGTGSHYSAKREVSSIDMDTPSTSSASIWQTDWKKCCLCQQDKRGHLQGPTSQSRMAYTNITTNVPLFQAKCFTIMLDPARLDEGGGIDLTLRKNKAKYHQSCCLMFNSSKLQRAQKRASLANKSSTTEDSPCPRKM